MTRGRRRAVSYARPMTTESNAPGGGLTEQERAVIRIVGMRAAHRDHPDLFPTLAGLQL